VTLPVPDRYRIWGRLKFRDCFDRPENYDHGCLTPFGAAAMKTNEIIKCLLVLAMALLLPGCATKNVNPPQARAHTGYVDLHASPPGGLSWEVSCHDDRAQAFKRVFSELKPPAGGILRLAFAPGHHRLRITFLNRVVAEPVEISVEVEDGKITPVHITLTDVGSASVRTTDVGWGATAKGLYGRRVTIGDTETAAYVLSAAAETPLDYQPKQLLSDAH